MAQPSLLLLDEPSLGLAPLLVKEIFQIIRRVNRELGTTLMLVEQNANMALQIAHYGYVMENGCDDHSKYSALLFYIWYW